MGYNQEIVFDVL
jgi:hypothetical protein